MYYIVRTTLHFKLHLSLHVHLILTSISNLTLINKCITDKTDDYFKSNNKKSVDKLITIPINEDSESLNVANAASIAMFQLQKNIIKS